MLLKKNSKNSINQVRYEKELSSIVWRVEMRIKISLFNVCFLENI